MTGELVVVLQVQPQHAVRAVIEDLEVRDVVVVPQQPGHLGLQLGSPACPRAGGPPSRRSGCGSAYPRRDLSGSFPRSPYQLALRTPGISPFKASSRKQIRQRPNFRSTARLRPQRWQRRTRAHLELRRALARSIQDSLCHRVRPYDRLRLPTRPAASRRGTASPSSRSSAMRQVVPVGRRHDRDVHPVDLLDLVVVDLGEDHLLLDPERVVARARRSSGSAARGSRGCAGSPG